MDYMLMPFRRYADFSGRSRRKEYWMFALFYVIALAAVVMLILVAATVKSEMLTSLVAIVTALFALGSFIPSLAVQVRRFHDQELSGWLILINLVPTIGSIIVLVMMCIEGTRGPNRYGPDPKDIHGDDGVADVFR